MTFMTFTKQLNQEELVDISVKALGVLHRHGVISEVPTYSAIKEEIGITSGFDFVLPLHILSMEALALPCYSLTHADDCNTYEDEGYYKEQLEKLSRTSNGRIVLRDIEERWKDGSLTLSFTLNGLSRVIEIDAWEQDDLVPESFVKLQLEILEQEIDGWKYVLGSAHEAAGQYFPVPVDAARELEALEANVVKK